MKDVASIGRPYRITGTVANLNSPGIIGIIVASSASGTIQISDTAQPGGTVQLGVMALAAGTFVPLNMRCTGATTVTVGGTLDATLILTA